MTTLTPQDHVALELCPQHVDCAACQHRADAVSRFVDEKLADAYAPVHELMRGWNRNARVIFGAPARAGALLEVLEELRKVVGPEVKS